MSVYNGARMTWLSAYTRIRHRSALLDCKELTFSPTLAFSDTTNAHSLAFSVATHGGRMGLSTLSSSLTLLILHMPNWAKRRRD